MCGGEQSCELVGEGSTYEALARSEELFGHILKWSVTVATRWCYKRDSIVAR